MNLYLLANAVPW